MQTIYACNLISPFSSCTYSRSQHAFYAYDCYVFDVASMWDKEELILFEEAQSSKNFMATMRLEQ